MVKPLKNELALITGGAVRLGKTIALALAEEGYSIALHYNRSESEALVTARAIEKMGRSVYVLQADLREPSSIEVIFHQISKISTPLKVLVNSASIMLRGSLLTATISEWDDTININLRAPWLTSQAAAKLMQANGGVIINISDSGAGKTWTGYPVYVVSKAGLEALTRLLARTLAPKIRVNAIAPGLILPAKDISMEDWSRLENRLPARRSGTPEDVVQTILFLLKNEYITGETLTVDGGYQLI